MILLSNGGDNSHRAAERSDTIVVGTVDGIAILQRSEKGWDVVHRALAGCFVSAVTAAADGTLFAATHGVGVARSRDGGRTWAGSTTASTATICGPRAPESCRARTWCWSARCRRIFISARTMATPGAS